MDVEFLAFVGEMGVYAAVGFVAIVIARQMHKSAQSKLGKGISFGVAVLGVVFIASMFLFTFDKYTYENTPWEEIR